ncbi:hypothetical protein FGB62_582g00 [Gracilaria domingensis]|nr:hypothetical protein FGB62_582g00 [Gracilaria domingensis]
MLAYGEDVMYACMGARRTIAQREHRGDAGLYHGGSQRDGGLGELRLFGASARAASMKLCRKAITFCFLVFPDCISNAEFVTQTQAHLAQIVWMLNTGAGTMRLVFPGCRDIETRLRNDIRYIYQE